MDKFGFVLLFFTPGFFLGLSVFSWSEWLHRNADEHPNDLLAAIVTTAGFVVITIIILIGRKKLVSCIKDIKKNHD